MSGVVQFNIFETPIRDTFIISHMVLGHSPLFILLESTASCEQMLQSDREKINLTLR